MENGHTGQHMFGGFLRTFVAAEFKQVEEDDDDDDDVFIHEISEQYWTPFWQKHWRQPSNHMLPSAMVTPVSGSKQ